MARATLARPPPHLDFRRKFSFLARNSPKASRAPHAPHRARSLKEGVWNQEKTCELRSCTGGILLRRWAGAPSRTRCPWFLNQEPRRHLSKRARKRWVISNLVRNLATVAVGAVRLVLERRELGLLVIKRWSSHNNHLTGTGRFGPTGRQRREDDN